MYIVRSFYECGKLLSSIFLMVMTLPPVCIHHPLLSATLSLCRSLWCPHGFPCSHLCLTLTYAWLCLGFAGSQRAALFGTKTKRSWPASTHPPSLLHFVPHPRHPLNPPQAKVVFDLCHHHGLSELIGLTFRVILLALLLDLSWI